jgi:hypothetical protein
MEVALLLARLLPSGLQPPVSTCEVLRVVNSSTTNDLKSPPSSFLRNRKNI